MFILDVGSTIMPLLRSLSPFDDAAAIDMALLAELALDEE